MLYNSTTDLKTIRTHPKLFTWGKVQAIHDIGAYTIVEYKAEGASKAQFHVYVDGRSTSNGAATLEGALILAIARKALDPNLNLAHYMAQAACKLLGIKEE